MVAANAALHAEAAALADMLQVVAGANASAHERLSLCSSVQHEMVRLQGAAELIGGSFCGFVNFLGDYFRCKKLRPLLPLAATLPMLTIGRGRNPAAPRAAPAAAARGGAAGRSDTLQRQRSLTKRSAPDHRLRPKPVIGAGTGALQHRGQLLLSCGQRFSATHEQRRQQRL
jgi:hypothetical protein